jgi:tetratricopeptide (TPR) repeat protein
MRVEFSMMIKARPLLLLAGLSVLVFAPSGSFAQTNQSTRQLTQGSQSTPNSQKRLALVIGNGAYTSAPPLKNPPNDARDMATTLGAVGFEVSSGVNLGQREMKRLIREFGQKLKGGGSGLFYYAGHGVQSKGRNYLIPVDAEIQSEAEVEDSGVDVGLVLNYMDEAQNGLNIVILDACRNNPFGRSFRSAAEGLAQVDAPTGTLIAYATAPGRVASDGSGQNGLYTSELLKQMRVPGVGVTDMFMRVRAEVMKQTVNKQVPWESSSLVGAFYFSGNSATSNSGPGSDKGTPPPPVNSPTIELSFWDSIKNSTNAEDFNAYLRKYPNGEFADLARIRAANLSKDSAGKSSASLNATRGGIGIHWELRDKRTMIVQVEPNGPAEQAGLRSGDEIIRVDGQNVAQMSEDQIVSAIRGLVGTRVTLTVRSAGSSRDVLLTRTRSAAFAAMEFAETARQLQLKELWVEAEAQYREALKLDTDVAWYYGELGITLYRQKRDAEAEVEIRRALRMDPKFARYHSILALVLFVRINIDADISAYSEAEAEARKGVQLDPKDVWNHNMLGLVFLAEKKWAEAASQFTEAVRLDPNVAEYKDNLLKAQQHKRP